MATARFLCRWHYLAIHWSLLKDNYIFLVVGTEIITWIPSLVYDPGEDTWSERTPLPTRRAFTGAVVLEGKILVIGGYDGINALMGTEIYYPERDMGTGIPWDKGPALPEDRFAMGISNLTDSIYVIGGKGNTGAALPPLLYLPGTNSWETFEEPDLPIGEGVGLVPLGNYLFVVGGKNAAGSRESHPFISSNIHNSIPCNKVIPIYFGCNFTFKVPIFRILISYDCKYLRLTIRIGNDFIFPLKIPNHNYILGWINIGKCKISIFIRDDTWDSFPLQPQKHLLTCRYSKILWQVSPLSSSEVVFYHYRLKLHGLSALPLSGLV